MLIPLDMVVDIKVNRDIRSLRKFETFFDRPRDFRWIACPDGDEGSEPELPGLAIPRCAKLFREIPYLGFIVIGGAGQRQPEDKLFCIISSIRVTRLVRYTIIRPC